MALYRCSKRACGRIWKADSHPETCPWCSGRKLHELGFDELEIEEIVAEVDKCDESTEEGLELQAALFQLAAAAGDLWGITNLGWCYEAGAGVEQDDKQAVWLYTQAAEMGYPPAQCNLAVCYESGIGVAADIEEAAELFHAAAERGYPRAQFCLARYYENGICVRKNEEKAVEWYQAAAWQNYPPAMTSLGWCCEFGAGTEKSPEAAVLWYTRAAEAGDPNGQCNLVQGNRDRMRALIRGGRWLV
jgi:hypothetical protein